MGVNWRSKLPISTNDQLIVCNDTGLNGRGPVFVNNKILISLLNRTHFQQPCTQSLSRRIASNDSNDASICAQGHQVSKDVGRATQMHGLPTDLHNWYGSLRRNTRHISPDELIKHDIAQDNNCALRDSSEKL